MTPSGNAFLLAHRVSDCQVLKWLPPAQSVTLSKSAFVKALDNALATVSGTAHDTHVLTLDDGFRENITFVLEAARQRKLSLMFFVTTGFVDREVEPIELQLLQLLPQCQVLPPLQGRSEGSRQRTDLCASYNQLRTELKPKRHPERVRFIEALAKRNGLEVPRIADSACFSWNELAELSKEPDVAIGAHSITHPFLPSLSLREQWRELSLPRLELQQRLGCTVDALAYPYGGHNVITRLLAVLAGYRLAFSTNRTARFGKSMALTRLDLNRIAFHDRR